MRERPDGARLADPVQQDPFRLCAQEPPFVQSRASPHMSDSCERGRIRIKPAIRGKTASLARLLVLTLFLESGLIIRGRQDLPVFSEEESRAIIDTAHRRGVPVTVHVTAVMNLAKAVDYGFDEIAHMVADRLSDGQLITKMIASDIHWVPTLELWSFFNLAPAAVANLRGFVQAGGKVALGTDFSGALKPFQLGMPMREIELMQEAGMTPMQIVVAATKHAAHVCNLEATLGTLERGKVADVLVVNGDPLQDLHALTNVRLVVRSGTIIRDTGS